MRFTALLALAVLAPLASTTALASPEADPEPAIAIAQDLSTPAARLEALKRAVGSACSYYSPTYKKTYPGTCQHTDHCESLLDFHVDNKCPNDVKDVKCCIDLACKSNKGWCMNNDSAGRKYCAQVEGKFATGYCPGPNDVQCCVIG